MNRKGNQKPRIDIYHDGDISLAEKTITLWEHYNQPLLPWQKSIIRRWMAIGEDGKWANQNAGLLVPRQNGKDLAESTDIPTPIGWKKLGDIKVGDYVFGDDGKPTKVIAKYEPEESDFYEIDFGNAGGFVNETVKTGGGHLWEVSMNDWTKPKVVDTNWIYANFERIKSHKQSFGIKLCQPVEYGRTELPIDPYLLGLWLGDGSAHSGEMTCHIDDYKFYKPHFEKVGKCHVVSCKSGNVITFRIDGWHNLLRTNNLLDNKHIPKAYMLATMKDRLELLRGLMDTDGSAEKHSSAVSFSQSGRPELVSQIMELICSLGMKPSYRVKELSKIKESYKDCQELRFNVIGEQVFNLPRKRAVFDSFNTKRQQFNKWYIKDIRRIEKKERYYCLGVDNESHLFLCTRSYIPTHNTETAICRILGGMVFLGEHLIYTAHQGNTVDEIKRRVLKFFYDADPEIRDLLTSEFDKEPKSFDYVELRNGGRCIFRTRTRSSGLGYTSDTIINDECFLADTIVDGKKIQDIRVGDMVRSLNKNGEIEYRKVTRIIKKPRPQVLTSIQIGDKELVSTRNHRHLTQRGWVRAEDIKPGDYLFYDQSREVDGLLDTTKTQMPCMRSRDRLSKHKTERNIQKEGLLLLYEYSLLKCWPFNRDERGAKATQSNVERRKQKKSKRVIKANRSQATNSWRKRHWANRATEKASRLIRRGLERGIVSKGGCLSERGVQHSCELQTRLGEQRTQTRGGVRWEQPSPTRSQATRCEKGCRFIALRVDGIAFQKRTNIERSRLSDGGDYVYCIDVEENHNFIANGFITHNCQEENDAQEEALLPTISAGPLGNPQEIMMGTPPTSGSAGTVFLRARRNLLQGKSDICWQEWSVENITDNHDEDAWYETNPSLGYFLSLKAVKAEANAMSQDSFNKMRLGWVMGIDAKRLFTDDEWGALAVKEVKLPPEPRLVYTVKFSPDRSSVTLAVGVVMDDKTHVEVIERKRMSEGIAWLTRWLLERWRKADQIIIDGAAGQGLLIEELLRSEPKLKKRILTPNVKEAGSAYASFYQAIQDQTVTHFNQPILNSAIRTCQRRDIGKDGMFGFAPLNANIQMDAVDAVAFAYYGANRFSRVKKSTTQQRVILFD